jgi:hypothetical protein
MNEKFRVAPVRGGDEIGLGVVVDEERAIARHVARFP